MVVLTEATAFRPASSNIWRPRLACSGAAGALEPTWLGLCLGQWPVYGIDLRPGRALCAIQAK